MPVLHKYNSAYHKSGYYVKVNWSAPHPYPLQTPIITERIYRELGFEAEDEVPNELTSRLFNAGLHWTEGSGAGDPQKQTDLDSISDANLPDVDPGQLEKVYTLLAEEEFSLDGQTVNDGSLNELKSELNQLREAENNSQEGPGPSCPDQIISDLRDENLTYEQAMDIRGAAENQSFFDESVYQFGRKHPITPRKFCVNEHGNPTYRFQTGPIKWDLADCRSKTLDFEWAVTIAPETDRAYDLRISRTQLVRIVSNQKKLTNQQTVDLISVVPCLLWVFDVLDGYLLSDSWHAKAIEDELPSPRDSWLTDQIHACMRALDGDTLPDEGTVIDIPNRNFARIRSPERHIICTSVQSLPECVDLGSQVSFNATQRYGSYYATEVNLIASPIGENNQDTETSIIFEQTGDSLTINRPVSEMTAESAIEVIIDVLELVRPAVAITNEIFQALLLHVESETKCYDEILYHLLKCTPFDSTLFPDLVTGLYTHHRIPRDDLSFRTLPLAVCVAFFYDSIDAEKAVSRADMQGDSTVFYRRDGECVIVGDELVWHAFSAEPSSTPRVIRDEITVSNKNREMMAPVNKAVTALSEQQFHLNCTNGDTFISEILKHGLPETGGRAIYLCMNSD